ncbi:MAG: phage integrase N-terminal domain-containing protein [Cocleimonas sp.]
MSKLTWELKILQRRNHDGGRSTQHNRKKILIQIAKQLKEIGFNQMGIHSLKAKHTIKLVDKWKKEDLNPGTIKNRMAHLRWWASKVNATHKIPTNKQLGIAQRIYITNVDKSIVLKQEHLSRISDPFLKLSLRLQSEFGLRREESIKFIAAFADKGKSISLKDTWCKGKRAREIPIITDSQRKLIDEIKRFTGDKSLIPQDKMYKHQLNKYRNNVTKNIIGFSKGHGLRHNYAQQRYKALSGNNCPLQGGKHQRDMTNLERNKDREVRLIISEELGHSREQITSSYLGS